MKPWTAVKVVLGASAMGATVMLALTTVDHPVAVSAATAPATETPATTSVATSAASTATTTPAPAKIDGNAVAEHVRQAVRNQISSATIGMEVYDTSTGTVVTSLNADKQFASMSVVKLLIALDVL